MAGVARARRTGTGVVGAAVLAVLLSLFGIGHGTGEPPDAAPSFGAAQVHAAPVSSGAAAHAERVLRGAATGLRAAPVVAAASAVPLLALVLAFGVVAAARRARPLAVPARSRNRAPPRQS